MTVLRAILRPLAVAALLATGLVAGGSAQESSRQQAAALSAQLMSPFCPGRLLVDCTSSQAYELRETITRRLAAGESAAAVRADLVREYGHEILGAPAAEGVGLLAWLVPWALGLTTLAGLAWKVLASARAGSAAPFAAAPAGAAGALARLDAELRDLD